MVVKEIGLKLYGDELEEIGQQMIAAKKVSNGPAQINLTFEHGYLTKWGIQVSEITEHCWSGVRTDEAPKTDYSTYRSDYD